MKAKPARLVPAMFAAATVIAVAVAPAAHGDPPPLPPCQNADGSACSNINAGGADIGIPYGPNGEADRGGATGSIPYGPSGSANGGGASGAIPYGPSGSADRGGASGCWFNLGCISIPAP
jgi:hypothetical protein